MVFSTNTPFTINPHKTLTSKPRPKPRLRRLLRHPLRLVLFRKRLFTHSPLLDLPQCLLPRPICPRGPNPKKLERNRLRQYLTLSGKIIRRHYRIWLRSRQTTLQRICPSSTHRTPRPRPTLWLFLHACTPAEISFRTKYRARFF